MKDTLVYPEMGQKVETDTVIEYKVTFGGKFYITTDLELSGRGIRQNGDGSDHRRGKKTYTVTQCVMDDLKTKYNCSYIALL